MLGVGKYSRLGKNTVLIFVGNIGSKVISLVMLPFYTKWLSVADYGTVDLISIYAGLLLGIVTYSISEAIFIFPKGQKLSKQKEYFSSALFFSIISLSVAAGLFYVINWSFFYCDITNIFTQYTWVIYWIIAASFLQSFIQQFSRSIDKVNVYAISGIVLTVFLAVLSILLIPKFGLMGYIFAQIVSLLITAFYSFIFTKAYIYLSYNAVKFSDIKEMLSYSVPLIPNGIMWWLVGSLNRPVMEKYLDMNAIGLFAVANKFPSVINMLFAIFIFSWQITVLEEFNKKGYKEFYNRILRVLFTGLTLLSCGMAVFSKLVISLLVDEKFYEAWKFVPILSIAVLFSSLASFVGTNFSATKESKYYFYSSIWGAIVSIFLNFVLILNFDLIGAAISVVLSHVVMALVRIKYSWKYVPITKIHPYFFMIAINILVILSVYYIDSFLFRSLVIVMLFLLFMLINKDMTKDIRLAFNIIKNRNK